MEVYVAPVRDFQLMSPKKFLHTQQPREDYRKFVEMIIFFLILKKEFEKLMRPSIAISPRLHRQTLSFILVI